MRLGSAGAIKMSNICTTMPNKHCPRCGRDLPTSEFWRDKARHDGLGSICKHCHYEYYNKKKNYTAAAKACQLRYWRSPKGKRKKREQRYREAYGITLAEYDRMFTEQAGRCFICGRTQETQLLSVDHDHETGKVRRLLCVYCNNCLAWFEKYRDVVEAYPKVALR